MEKTHLNTAHEVGRRAVKFVRRGQLSDAIKCHLKAAAILYELKETLSEDSQCKRSLQEQFQFHKRQAELAEVLKNFFDKGKGERIIESKSMDRKRVLEPISSNRVQLHPEILRQIDEADSLLQILSGRQLTSDLPPDPHQNDDDVQAIEFTIRPKNDAEVIEELQIVNSNLRALVDRLLQELSQARKENDSLKMRLSEHESASNKRGRQDESAEVPPEVFSTLLRQSGYSENMQDIPELDPLDDPTTAFNMNYAHQ